MMQGSDQTKQDHLKKPLAELAAHQGQGRTDANNKYVLLPNGKVRYLRATAVDIFICILLPFIGFILGVFALVRKETQRAKTMLLISIIAFAIGTCLRLASA